MPILLYVVRELEMTLKDYLEDQIRHWAKTKKEATIDSDYYCRTLQFEATKPNALNKAKMDNPYDKLRR
jgi:hypothetical protein